MFDAKYKMARRRSTQSYPNSFLTWITWTLPTRHHDISFLVQSFKLGKKLITGESMSFYFIAGPIRRTGIQEYYFI
jgi:hypothetical protein